MKLSKRMIADGDWTLFSPEEVPDLHHLYGRRFEERYELNSTVIKNSDGTLSEQVWRAGLAAEGIAGHPFRKKQR